MCVLGPWVVPSGDGGDQSLLLVSYSSSLAGYGGHFSDPPVPKRAETWWDLVVGGPLPLNKLKTERPKCSPRHRAARHSFSYRVSLLV
jgi:hypothetical protein